MPIQKRALFAGILLPFISGIKNLSLFAILAVPGTDVLTTYALRLVEFQYTQAANAVVLMVAILSLLLAVLGQRLFSRQSGGGVRPLMPEIVLDDISPCGSERTGRSTDCRLACPTARSCVCSVRQAAARRRRCA